MTGLLEVMDAFGEEASLGAELDASSPFGEGQLEGDLGRQGAMEGPGGAEFGTISGEGGADSGAVLGGEGQRSSIGTMFDRIAAAARLTFRGARAGGFQGIAAVGSDLAFGGHGSS